VSVFLVELRDEAVNERGLGDGDRPPFGVAYDAESQAETGLAMV
jgi:hypothetical protein